MYSLRITTEGNNIYIPYAYRSHMHIHHIPHPKWLAHVHRVRRTHPVDSLRPV